MGAVSLGVSFHGRTHTRGRECSARRSLSFPGRIDSGTNDERNENNFSLLYLRGVPFENFISSSLQDVAREQDKDPILKDVKTRWTDNNNPSIRNYDLVRRYILYLNSDPSKSNWVFCIPDEWVNKLIWYTHLSYAHYGPRKCYMKLRDTCYFINMEKRIRRLLATCKACQKAKPPTMSHHTPLFPIIPSRLREMAAVDLFGPLPRTVNGHSYIFVAVELTSKFVTFTPLKGHQQICIAGFCKRFLNSCRARRERHFRQMFSVSLSYLEKDAAAETY